MRVHSTLVFTTICAVFVFTIHGCKDNPEAPEEFSIWVTPQDTALAVGDIVTFVVHHSGEWPRWARIVYDFHDGTGTDGTSAHERQHAYNLPGEYPLDIRVLASESTTVLASTSTTVVVTGSPGILEFTRDTVRGVHNVPQLLTAIYSGPPVFSNEFNCECGEYRWELPDRPIHEFLDMISDTATYSWSPAHGLSDYVVVSLVARNHILCSDTCLVIIR